MHWLLPFAVWTAVSTVWHEAGHAVAARAGGMRVKAFQVGVGRPFTRLGPLALAPWPLGLGIDVDDGDLSRAGAGQRAALHAAGPAANLLLGVAILTGHGLRLPDAALGAYINLILGASNLLPLPFLDGGWLTSLGLGVVTRRSFADELRWHRRWAAPVWCVAAAAILALTWHGAG